GVGTTTLWQTDLRIALHDGRGLETLGDPAFQRPGIRRTPDTVQTGSPVTAIELVVVHTHAASQGEGWAQAPFIFQEQRVLTHGSIHARTIGIGIVAVGLQFALAPLKTAYQHVISQRQSQLAIDHGIANIRANGLRWAIAISLLAVKAQFGIKATPAAGMRQRIAIAHVLVFISLARQCQGLARCSPEVLSRAACFKHELMIVIGSRPQAYRAVLAFGARKAIQNQIFLTLLVIAPELQAQTPRHKGARQVQIG